MVPLILGNPHICIQLNFGFRISGLGLRGVIMKGFCQSPGIFSIMFPVTRPRMTGTKGATWDPRCLGFRALGFRV